MDSDFIVIKTVKEFLEAEIIKSKLDSFGVPCFLKKESVRGLFGLYMNKLGAVKILVPAEFEDKALEILNEET